MLEDQIQSERKNLYRNLNALILLGVLCGIFWAVFLWDLKTCRACDGVGRLEVMKVRLASCGYCDGDGRVSLWKSTR